MEPAENKYSLILFDGVCNLCNSSVNRVIKNDKKNKFKFAALQSEKGFEIQKKYQLDTTKTESMILIENNKVYYKSSAALRTARGMDKLYPLLFVLIIIPAFIRDFVYDFIAKNRYKWFGKKESCMIPTQEMKERFIF